LRRQIQAMRKIQLNRVREKGQSQRLRERNPPRRQTWKLPTETKSIRWMSERKSMSADITRYLDLLEQRIVLLGSLADALVSAGASISAFRH
jgi:hypothetical protein